MQVYYYVDGVSTVVVFASETMARATAAVLSADVKTIKAKSIKEAKRRVKDGDV